MRFSQSFLDEIRARVSISSVIGRTVQWDKRKTNADKDDFWACCPFHGGKTASFHCEDKKGRYHCFVCKLSGDIFTYLMEKEGIPFPDAVKRLAIEAGLDPSSSASYQPALVTLGDLRRKSQALEIGCSNCNRHQFVDAKTLNLPDDIPVPRIANRLRCTQCGFRNTTNLSKVWARADARSR